jgi:hypothetical protein
MSGASRRCRQTTFADSTSATSSQGSVDGAEHCFSLDGPTTSQSGPAAVHASPSAMRERAADSTTRGTCGRNCSVSSSSANLQLSLGSRLRRRLGSAGSTRSRVTWRVRTTPSGRRYFRLRASGRHTRETGCTSWPTPTVSSSHRNSGPEWGVGLLEAAWSLVSGLMPSGFDAQTGKGVQLNPEFVLWLMGFPATWLSCGERAMRSCRSRRRSS